MLTDKLNNYQSKRLKYSVNKSIEFMSNIIL